MEKIININFQGRVIPIEESAYEALKQYTDGLRRHFANEESGDEIINDIESRIAELLAARLKLGANCINIADLNAVIDSIGRIEDIKAADGEEEPKAGPMPPPQERPIVNERFYRNADDKVIAGVCSGLANRLGLDPVVVRVLFVLLFGALFWIYILLWLIVPIRSGATNITHRLFRNPDGKVIAGVCGGLAVYFKMESWKIRLVFLAPIIISILFRSMDIFTWHFGFAPGFFIGSFGSTFFILYVILWIAIPYASSSTDKMEMRGEKIDINSIKAATQARTHVPPYPTRSAGASIGRVIAILFKAFFLFVAGCVALGLFAGLIGLVFAGMATAPFMGFFLHGFEERALVWIGVSLTLGLPLLALIVWFIRRIMGVRSRRHYLGYVFAGLWVVGIVCTVIITSTILRNFATRAVVEEEMQITQPSTGRMYINVSHDQSSGHSVHYGRWFNDDNDENNAFRFISKDSLWINTVKVNIEQSPDSFFHIHETRASRGTTAREAREIAGHIQFSILQQDSIISLGRGFTISSRDKFRNQQVIMTVEVPLGKTVEVSKDVEEYSWFTINEHGRGVHYTRHQENAEDYRPDKEYIMTVKGLVKTDTTDREEDEE